MGVERMGIEPVESTVTCLSSGSTSARCPAVKLLPGQTASYFPVAFASARFVVTTLVSSALVSAALRASVLFRNLIFIACHPCALNILDK